nr:MAG TPA: nucelotide kinase [Caudoviricetes sp.]
MGIPHIERPDHYVKGRQHEPKDVIRDWDLNFNLGNVIKYISRAGRKGHGKKKEDLLKAKQYLEFELAYLESLEGEVNAKH